MHQPPWLSENDVDRAVDVRDAIPAVAAAIEHEARGLAGNIAKTMTTWDPASAAHALGGFDHATARVAFKTWVNTPVGAESLLSLFDATNGRILALMQSVTLGVIRTAAVSGVATDLLADPGADELAIIGSGRQALRQVAAVAAVRPLRRVRVWSPTPASRAGFAEQISAELGIVAEALPSLEAAVADAPIVTVVTRAREPFFPRGILAPGAHLNAIGAILPHAAEFDSALLADSSITVVDNLENARRASRELIEFYGDDFSPVQTLGDLMTGAAARPLSPALTVFKGMGMGLADLAVANVAAANHEGVPTA
ncbi:MULTISPECIES: ornithine cyclodeaminase family protein [Mycobacteriales]|nr:MULTISPECIES: ornithine cyclodeaminase family protein [Mycobacteriales]QUD82671.1 ornithine cyclodeaminase family protein [Gordonia polyisoprenivorans]GAB22243.1 ornithine cyclodeaminase/mu-crystallin family protein [Gordonia polyisoprenivorans NBRC 16320 = JCM 10675]